MRFWILYCFVEVANCFNETIQNPKPKIQTGFYNLEPERRTEEFEGVVETLVFYDTSLASVLKHVPANPPPTLRKNIGWKLKMHGRTMLELVGLRKKEEPSLDALFR